MSQSFLDENSLSKSFSMSVNLNKSHNKSVLHTPGSAKKNKLAIRTSKPEAQPSFSRLSQNLQVNSNKTPLKSPAVGDRFIPDRQNIDFSLSNFLMENNTNKKSDSVLNEYAGDISAQRVLSFQKDKAPKSTDNYKQKVIYSSYKSNTVSKSKRYIPLHAERILDAPDITNNYYLQLIDWSSRNVLAVALKNEVYLWDATTGNIDNLLELEGDQLVTSVSFSSGGNFLAVGTSEGITQLWDIIKKKRLRLLRNASDRISCLSWNKHVLSGGSQSGVIYNHDVRVSPTLISKFEEHQLEVCGLKWDPSGKYLASGANDNTVKIWDSASMSARPSTGAVQPSFQYTEHQAAIKAIAWCPWKANTLATGGGTNDRKLRIWNTQNGATLYQVDSQSQISAVLWSQEYRELITSHGYMNNELIIWKYPSMEKSIDLIGHQARVLGMALSPDETTVCSIGADETLRFWECFQIDEKRRKNKAKNTEKENNILSKGTIR